MSKLLHSKRHEWAGYTIRESKTGFILDRWCNVQGAITGRRVLVPYGETFPKGTDFSKPWNAHISTGDAFCYAATELKSAKVLRKGHVVGGSATQTTTTSPRRARK